MSFDFKKVAFVFPGQGSQTVGMFGDLAQRFTAIEQTFAEASAVLNYDLWQLVKEGPAEKLNQTEFTQPALLAADVAAWRVLMQQEDLQQPAYLAGHSLGEYAALVCAEALNFQDAVKLVAQRGRLMQEAVPLGVGAMLAVIGLSDSQIDELCERAAQGQLLTPANYNAIGQVVLAGEVEAAQRAIEIAKEMGAKIVKQLPMSVPAHCALMQTAATNLAELLQQIEVKAPTIPVVHNVDVSTHTEPKEIRELLSRQLYSPVRWVETIQYFAHEGVDCIVECGPGKVLVGLNKRTEPSVSTADITTILSS